MKQLLENEKRLADEILKYQSQIDEYKATQQREQLNVKENQKRQLFEQKQKMMKLEGEYQQLVYEIEKLKTKIVDLNNSKANEIEELRQ